MCVPRPCKMKTSSGCGEVFFQAAIPCEYNKKYQQ